MKLIFSSMADALQALSEIDSVYRCPIEGIYTMETWAIPIKHPTQNKWQFEKPDTEVTISVPCTQVAILPDGWIIGEE